MLNAQRVNHESMGGRRMRKVAGQVKKNGLGYGQYQQVHPFNVEKG